MKKINVELDERSYEIIIGTDIPVASVLQGKKDVRAHIVSDSNVYPLYGAKYCSALEAVGIKCSSIVIDAGEKSKNLDNIAKIYESALDAEVDRSGVMIALGGGVVGDLTGFAAATYLRGVKYIQAPTTLLAMVDSSVGGKTGINLPRGKNLAGSFYQPVEVDAELSTFSTLPDKEFKSGLAEVIKYGVIWDAKFFEMLEKNIEAILNKDMNILEKMIGRCCEIKAEIVAMDEKESGVRSILNLGHTFGHAIETAAGYGAWMHGEAVAAGMAYAIKLSTLTGKLEEGVEMRVRNLISKAGLPLSPIKKNGKADWKKLRTLMTADKKSRGGTPRFVLVEKIGSVVYGSEVPDNILESAFKAVSEE